MTYDPGTASGGVLPPWGARDCGNGRCSGRVMALACARGDVAGSTNTGRGLQVRPCERDRTSRESVASWECSSTRACAGPDRCCVNAQGAPRPRWPSLGRQTSRSLRCRGWSRPLRC